MNYIALIELTPNKYSVFISAGIIIAFFVIMYIKKHTIGKSDKKGTALIDLLLNILIFIAFGISILLTLGYDFSSFQNDFVGAVEEQANKIISSGVVVIICICIYNIAQIIFKSTMRRKHRNEKRVKTMGKVMISILKYCIYIIAIIVILAVWGVNIIPFLTGLGIAGLVIGLGAQKLVSDFVAGLFIIFEHHFDVGDCVQINGFKGEVIDIGLKTTKVKNWEGQVKIVSNSDISDVINFSIYDTTFVTEIAISYDEDVEKVLNILNKKLPLHYKGNNDIITMPKADAVSGLSGNAVIIRIITVAKSETHYAIRRDLYKYVKEIFDENNITIPYPQVVIHQGDKND